MCNSAETIRHRSTRQAVKTSNPRIDLIGWLVYSGGFTALQKDVEEREGTSLCGYVYITIILTSSI